MKSIAERRRPWRISSCVVVLLFQFLAASALAQGGLALTDFSPASAPPGTRISILMEGLVTPAPDVFRPELPAPKDLCAILRRDDGRIIPLEVVDVNANGIIAILIKFDQAGNRVPLPTDGRRGKGRIAAYSGRRTRERGSHCGA